METTHFRRTPQRGPNTKGQIAIYAAAAVLSVALLIVGAMAARARASAPVQPVDPNSFAGGLAQVFALWKRDVLHSTPPTVPTPAPKPFPTPYLLPEVTTQAPAAAATPTPTPYEPTDQEMSEWKHVPPNQEQHYAEYSQRMAARQQPTPRPTPYLMPEVVADTVAGRHAAWQTLHDAYVTQVRVRVQNARTDAEKGQIQRDIATWKAANPEPAKPTPTPNENEIPIH